MVVFLHLAFWALLLLLPYLLSRPIEDREGPQSSLRRAFQYHFLLSVLSWIALFYTNANLLLPRLFFRRRYGAYLLALLGVLLLLFSFNRFSFLLLLPRQEFHIGSFIGFYFMPCLFILAVSTAYRTLQDRLETDRRTAQRETLTLKTELAFLRSQVSPHFMFNVLNNMVALARKKSDLLEPSLIKLSSLLRYMLYETDEDLVPLEKEVSYLQSYIDLQQQRFRGQVTVEARMHEVDGAYEIAPMLLIPFVENAFKHGTGFSHDAQILIRLQAQAGRLEFSVSNRFQPNPAEVKDRSSGIGLSNVTRRLDLIYPKRHELAIRTEEGWYHIALHLTLSA